MDVFGRVPFRDAAPTSGRAKVLFRTGWLLGVVVLVGLVTFGVVMIVRCIWQDEVEFSPGTWVSEDGGTSITLTHDGTSHVVAVPYKKDVFLWCEPEVEWEYYTGHVSWDWDGGWDGDQNQIRMVFDELPYRQVIFLGPAGMGPSGGCAIDWTRIYYWPCGDPDVEIPFEYMRKEDA